MPKGQYKRNKKAKVIKKRKTIKQNSNKITIELDESLVRKLLVRAFKLAE